MRASLCILISLEAILKVANNVRLQTCAKEVNDSLKFIFKTAANKEN